MTRRPQISWPSAPQPVGLAEIRRAFNAGGYYQRMLNGDIRAILYHRRACDSARTGEPQGTTSDLYIYMIDDQPVALVHQYTRPDGTIGASGQPDPKVLVRDTSDVIRPVASRRG